jgi:hypothetical protein
VIDTPSAFAASPMLNILSILESIAYVCVDFKKTVQTLALQEVAIRFAWFEKCVSNVQLYDLAADFDAQFIIDSVAAARAAFAQRSEVLRHQLLEAGLSPAKAEEIIRQQQFTLEHVSSAPSLSALASEENTENSNVRYIRSRS